MNWLLNIDYKIFEVINSLAGKWKILDWLAIFCAKYLIFVIFVIACVWWLNLTKTRPSHNWPIEGKRKWMTFGNIVLPPIFSIFVNQLFGLFIKFRERPLLNMRVHKLINFPMFEKSFPSDHTAVSFAIAFAIFLYDKKFGSLLIFLALLVGVSRVFVGVHYPLDIVGGIISAGLSILIFRLIFKRNKIKKSAVDDKNLI